MIVNSFPRGVKIYTDQIADLVAASVANTPGSIGLSWANPTSKKFVGVMIRYKEGSYPTSPIDGVQAYSGNGTSTTVTGLTGGTTYYFRAFAKATNNSGSKVFYNTTTTGAQAIRATISNQVTAFAVAKTSASSLTASWVAPSGAYANVMIRYKVGGYPTSVSDGTMAYEGTGTSVVVTGLAANTTYYFRAFVKNSSGAYNSNTSQQASNTTKLAAGQVIFTSSQVWTVPAGITSVQAFCVGGGGSGATGTYLDSYVMDGGGGGSGKTSTGTFTVSPGQTIAIAIGAGGAGWSLSDVALGSPGGASSFGALLSADGGLGAGADSGTKYWWNGGSGGSGGGRGAYSGSTGNPSNTGASDGGDTGTNWFDGKGQGTTTRAFAEVGNTLYAGGGGGSDWFNLRAGGGGGGGNGAKRNSPTTQASAGTPNTGGGGGGGGTAGGSPVCYAKSGGSGIVIVRWAEQ